LYKTKKTYNICIGIILSFKRLLSSKVKRFSFQTSEWAIFFHHCVCFDDQEILECYSSWGNFMTPYERQFHSKRSHVHALKSVVYTLSLTHEHSLAQSLTHIHMHTHTNTLSLYLSHTLSPSLSLSLSVPLFLTHIHSLYVCLSHSLSLTHTETFTDVGKSTSCSPFFASPYRQFHQH